MTHYLFLTHIEPVSATLDAVTETHGPALSSPRCYPERVFRDFCAARASEDGEVWLLAYTQI